MEAASKNRPADLINVALEKVVEAGLELPAFSTLDAMSSKVNVPRSTVYGHLDREKAVPRQPKKTAAVKP
ncbi:MULTISPECIES: hypothetical protein [unclassified Streptomyces]|uniref:hypothetical protein n=1 Tax=unclassified Streptomyces TaxID=2593676 RepID=UPI00340D282B